MGYPLHVVDRIGSPFLMVHEQVVLIPETGRHVVPNQLRKIIFVLQGECRHRIPAATSADGREVTLQPGDILVVPYACEQVYSSLRPETASRFLAVRLAFDPEAVPPLPPSHRRTPPRGSVETSLTALVRHHFQEARHLPQGQDPLIRETLAQLREEAQRQPPGYRLRVRGLCTSLVTLVARQVMPPERAALSPADDRQAYHVGVVKDYLLRHLDQPLSLGQVAAHAQLSEEYLARLFKQVTGQTVFEYIRAMRLERAKNYLTTSDRNVGEIARIAGYASLPVFSRSFKREFGLSPIEYRRFVAGDGG